MVVSCDELRCVGLIIESDSANCVQWVKNMESLCWKYANTINRIHNLMKECSSVAVVKIFREVNGFADALARQGVRRKSNFRLIF